MRTEVEIEHVLNTANVSIFETNGTDLEAKTVLRVLNWVLEKKPDETYRYPDTV